ncbi:MAG: flippase-like domain-containing protein [Armatimonadetes bacterium]|nr:flippase-like domain-containing protein [Armatimonadota bacterium]
MAEAESSRSGGAKRVLSWVARCGISVVLIGLLLRKKSVADAVGQLQAGVVWWVLAGVVLYLASQAINTLKWRVILDAMGHRLPYPKLLRVTLAGMFWNLFLPTAVGGDAARVVLMRAYDVPASTGTLSVLMQRVTGFVALLVIGVAGLVWSGELHDPVPRKVLVGLSLLLAVVVVAMAIGLALEGRFGLADRLPGWLGRPLRRIGDGLLALVRAPRAMLWVMVLSFVFQLWHVGLGWFLAQAVGCTASAKHYVWMVPVTSVGGMVPVGLGGIGSREQVAYLLLTPILGQAGVVWQLVWNAVMVLSSLFGGVVAAGAGARAAKPAGVES